MGFYVLAYKRYDSVVDVKNLKGDGKLVEKPPKDKRYKLYIDYEYLSDYKDALQFHRFCDIVKMYQLLAVGQYKCIILYIEDDIDKLKYI